MMKNRLLNTEIQDYMNANLNTDLHSLLLKKSPFEGVSMAEIVQQIKGKKVAQKKFKFLLKDGIIFPPHLNLEQASSESTAEFKAQNLTGKSFVDLTSGFGIDAYFLSENFEEITLVERNKDLSEIVEHNWNNLGREANFINTELEDFLARNTKKYDLVYLDPARRGSDDRKKFLLEDLSPNIIDIQDQLHALGNKVIIKLSPLIDISYLLQVIKNVSEVQIIAVRNEVKELLVIIYPDANIAETKISCFNLESEDLDFSFVSGDEKHVDVKYISPQKYLYLPNSAVLKSGAFNLIAERFQLSKLHPNTHFYTSEQLIAEFPGRILEVEPIQASQIVKGEKFNIISKNYPLTPDQIKKKYKIRDGGNAYLIFTQSADGKKIILKST